MKLRIPLYAVSFIILCLIVFQIANRYLLLQETIYQEKNKQYIDKISFTCNWQSEENKIIDIQKYTYIDGFNTTGGVIEEGDYSKGEGSTKYIFYQFSKEATTTMVKHFFAEGQNGMCHSLQIQNMFGENTVDYSALFQ